MIETRNIPLYDVHVLIASGQWGKRQFLAWSAMMEQR